MTAPNAPTENRVLTPIDEAIARPLQGLAERGRGFIFDLANELEGDGRKLTVELRQPKTEFNEWQPPSDLRKHQLTDTPSFVEYAKRYGSPQLSLVFVNPEQAGLVIDEGKERGKREYVTLPLLRSSDWYDWQNIQAKRLSHPELYRFLLEHEENLIDPLLLVTVSKIKATATVSHDSDLTDQGETYGVAFKTAKGDELARFPKAFKITLPVLEQDDTEDSDDRRERVVEVKLIVNMPKGPSENISFELKAPRWRYVERQRLLSEATAIRQALPGFLVVSGKPGYSAVELPEDPPAYEAPRSLSR